jgi:hypothetical protein
VQKLPFYLTLIVALFGSGMSVEAAEKEKGREKAYKKSERPPISLEDAFKKMDKNRDGSLAKAEFTEHWKDPISAAGKFDKADKDKDLSLSLAEFKAGGDKMISPRLLPKPASKKPAKPGQHPRGNQGKGGKSRR